MLVWASDAVQGTLHCTRVKIVIQISKHLPCGVGAVVQGRHNQVQPTRWQAGMLYLHEQVRGKGEGECDVLHRLGARQYHRRSAQLRAAVVRPEPMVSKG